MSLLLHHNGKVLDQQIKCRSPTDERYYIPIYSMLFVGLTCFYTVLVAVWQYLLKFDLICWYIVHDRPMSTIDLAYLTGRIPLRIQKVI